MTRPPHILAALLSDERYAAKALHEIVTAYRAAEWRTGEAARQLGVASSTLYDWRQRFPALDRAIRKGQAGAGFVPRGGRPRGDQ